MKPRICLTAGIAAAIAATGALADITIGVSIGFTGPQASLGVHYKNAFDCCRIPSPASRSATSSWITRPT